MTEKNFMLGTVAKGAGMIFIGTGLSYILSFIFQVIVANYLSIYDFGLFSIGLIILNVGLVFSNFGLPASSQVLVSYFIAKKENANAKGVVIASYVICFMLSFLIALAVYMSSNFISISIFKNEDLIPIVKIFSISIPFMTFIVLASDILLGMKEHWKYIVVNTVLDKLLRLLIIYTIILFGGGLIAISLGYVLNIVIVSVIAMFLIFILFFVNIKERPSYNNKDLLMFSIPLFLFTTIGVLIEKIDIISIGMILGPVDVAIYSVCFSFAILLTIVLFSLNAIYIPLLSGFIAKEENKSINNLFESVRRISFLGTLPMFIIVLLYSKEILGMLYGTEYSVGAVTMIALCFGNVVIILFGPLGSTLQAYKKTKVLFFYTLVAVIINIILNIILIPLIGILGAAIATIISLILREVLYLLEVRKIIKIKYSYTMIYKSIIVSAIIFVLFSLLKMLVVYSSIWILVINCLFILLLYLILLVKMRLLTEDDKNLIFLVSDKVGIKRKIAEKILN